jgi:subtilase-type serine protease
MSSYKLARFLLLTASTVSCCSAFSSTAFAQTGPTAAENYPGIVVRDDISLTASPPTGAFDNLVNVTGVGQIVVRPDQTSTSIGLCTGTLINPRTVIFAAHCVNDQAANSYGFASGGTAISVGFSANNLPGLLRWIGRNGGIANQTDVGTNIYNVEQVWYDERSIPNGFLEADVALATLDTHADGIPTWTLLFSPLTEETHGIVNGYGSRGLGSNGDTLGIDFRRRIAENMISSLSSLNDRNDWLFGPGNVAFPQSLYQLDFDNPAGQEALNGDPALGPVSFDFDLFDGGALPNEGTTAGGDSGGPLIADQAFDKPVVVGVLSGGSRFFGPQPFSSYGTSSFYQPLFMFWDQIVANNSYAYVTARPGDKNWLNPNHWVQTMDPNYAIASDGNLVNALPGFGAPGVSGDTPKFGNVCFLDDCFDLSTLSVPLTEGSPNSISIPGGPGSTNFVPNNVVANPAAGVRARYYEVTLNALGKTTLASDITIDRLNIAGLATLDIKRSGALKVWGDYTQTGGWLNVDGSLTSGEAFLGNGLLTGSGRFDPTYLTSVRGIIAPGSIDGAGTLTIAGDVILSSQTLTFFDVGRRGNDTLAVVADGSNTGIISLGGTAAVINPIGRDSARFGQTFTIVTAQGGVQNQFDDVVGRIGVLYPELQYLSNSVVAKMRAIRFTDFFGGNSIVNPFSLAFGAALDGLRVNSFNDLSSVYSIIDIQEAGELDRTFQGLSASVAGRATILDEKQSSRFRNLVTDRLSMLGTQQAAGGTLRILGNRDVFGAQNGLTNSAASQMSFTQNYQTSTWDAVKLPENVSGFMSAGFVRSSLAGVASDGSTNEGSWHIASGMEFALSDRTTFATAFGHSNGEQSFSGGRADVTTNQGAVYGSYRLGGGFYVGGQASFAQSRIESNLLDQGQGVSGNVDTSALGLSSEIEAGRNFNFGGIQLTPRASFGYSSYDVSGFRNGSGDLAMAVDKISRRGFEAKAGLKITGSTKLGRTSGWSLQPELKADYVRRLSGNDTNLQVRFLTADSIGLNLPIALQDASYGELKGGFRLTNGLLEFGAVVETRLGASQLYRDDRAALNMAVRF